MNQALLFVIGFTTLLVGCQPGTPQIIGTLERDRVRLTAEISEPIIEILVQEGEQVQMGQLLLNIDPRRTDARLAEARAQLASAEGRLRELLRGPRAESILESRANVEEMNAALSNARSEFSRLEQLVSQNLVSQAQLDQARSSRDSAEARLRAAEARLEAQLDGTTQEELDQSRAAVAGAEAAVEQLSILRERLDIRAPVDGRVETLAYRSGEQPAAGAALAIMLAQSPVYARVYLPQELRAQVAAGDVVDIAIAGVDQPLEGRVRFLASEASYTPFYALTEEDRGRLTYLAEIDVVGDTNNLPTGAPLSVSFPALND